MRLARDAVKTNRCVVIGLQSTGEARTLEQLERDDGELSDFVSTAKGVFHCLVSHFSIGLHTFVFSRSGASQDIFIFWNR